MGDSDSPLERDLLNQPEFSPLTKRKPEASSGTRWLLLLSLTLLLWVALPWIAPIFMRFGWESAARPIYQLYSLQCHQLPQRSFFLFGPQVMFSLSEVQDVWDTSNDPAILRKFIGSGQLGYKVAWSDRMVSAYSSILLGGALWFLFRRRIRFFPIWAIALLSIPMALDGVSHMVSDLSGLGAGFRFENVWLAELTQYRFPQSFYAGTTIGTFNSWMRLITGTLFGIGVGWFLFSSLGVALTRPRGMPAPAEVVSGIVDD